MNSLYDNPPAKLTLETYGCKTTWEAPGSDIDMEELLEAFHGLCVSHGFISDMVLDCMYQYAEEHLPNIDEDIYEGGCECGCKDTDHTFGHPNGDAVNDGELHTPYFDMGADNE